MRVSVAYCPGPDRQAVVELELTEGATVAMAIAASRLTEQYPEIESAPLRIGVFGECVAPEDRLKDGDRVEIYRPLKADPKQARRRRAARPPGKK